MDVAGTGGMPREHRWLHEHDLLDKALAHQLHGKVLIPTPHVVPRLEGDACNTQCESAILN